MILEAGDIAWTELDPIRGTEQSGRRPALVVSGTSYNNGSTRVVICPISTSLRNWPFNVPLLPGMRSRGFVLVDQVRSVDRGERVFRFVEKAPPILLALVHERLVALIGGQARVNT